MTRVRVGRRNSRGPSAGDPLTGLPSRVAVESYLAARAGAESGGVAVVVLDVDGFQDVNAALGYVAGDRLLVDLAGRLSACGPAVLARLGADRFAAVVRPGPDGGLLAAAAGLAAAATGALSTYDSAIGLGVSAGMAAHPEHGADPGTLLRRAEQAMREAKRRGDGEIGVPTVGGSAGGGSAGGGSAGGGSAGGGSATGGAAVYAAEQLALLADLRRAVSDPTDQSIRLYYQPQVDPRTGVVVGAEALPRWHLPGRSPLDPGGLFRAPETARAAHRTGVPRLLTGRVLDDVVAQLARWGDAVGDLRVSVNVTMSALAGPGLVDRLLYRLAERNLAAGRLQVEITQCMPATDPRAGLAALTRLHRHGVPIALDHFGTGAASLALLRRLPLTEVKIDRSFVLGAATDDADAAVVRSVVGLAGELGLRTVADGVEDERTWRALAGTGCVVQGWYCARPMPAERLVNWIALYRDRLRPQLHA